MVFALNKSQQNEYLGESKVKAADLKALETKVGEYAKVWVPPASQTDEVKGKVQSHFREIWEKLSGVVGALESESLLLREKYRADMNKPETLINEVNQTADTLIIQAEYVALVQRLDSIASRLISLQTKPEVDQAQEEITQLFHRESRLRKVVEKSLAAAGVKGLAATHAAATRDVAAIHDLLLSSDGMVAKAGGHVEISDKVAGVTTKLRQMVAQQNEVGKTAVTSALTQQEQSVLSVNKVVRLGIGAIVCAGIASVLIGIALGAWIYRSVTHPLSKLLVLSDQLAEGDISTATITTSKDEVGRVQESMGKVVANLRSIVLSLSASISSLTVGSSELQHTAGSLEQGAQKQQSMIEQSADSIEQMARMNGEVSTTTHSTLLSAQRMKSHSIAGKQIMDQTATKLHGFIDEVRRTVAKVEALGVNPRG